MLRLPFRAMGRGWHITARQIGDAPIAPDASARRALVRILLAVAGDALLAFHVVDTHLHLLLVGEAPAAEIVRRIEIAWTLRTGGPGFEPARIREVRDQHHLANTFLYVLRQAEHHAVHDDPCREASSIHDTLGLRLVDRGLPLRVRRELPRLERAELIAALGADLPTLRSLAPSGTVGLADAAAAALALPDLSGRSTDTVRALVAAAHATDALPTPLAAALGRSVRSTFRLRTEAPDLAIVAAIRGQLALRAAVPGAELAG